MEFKGDTMPLKELDDLKNRLLELVERESTCSLSEVTAWCDLFRSYFVCSVTPDNLFNVAVFRDVYQVLTFLLKISQPITDKEKEDYEAKFLATEEETRAWSIPVSNNVYRLARLFLRTESANLRLDPSRVSSCGRHGPGAVSGGERGSDKNFFDSRYDQLHDWFPFDLHFCNASLASELCSTIEHRGSRFITANLTLVPKTWKGPRGVFVSPKEAVFCQLGIDELIKSWVEGSAFGLSWDPVSQVPSQELAYIGSYNRWYCTLDLSDASDRVPLSLMSRLFHRSDYRALAATRPSYVRLPSGKIHKLRMLSPMGDGKTFSVLSVVCIALCVASIMDADGWFAASRNIGKATFQEYARKVRVFGDDIIVPSEYYNAVCCGLEAHNLKVNRRKSFVNGFFREACGCDAFKGAVVTPLRLKIDLDSLRYQEPCEMLPKLIGLHNYAVQKYPHLVRTIATLETIIHRFSPVPLGYTRRCDLQPLGLQSYRVSGLNRLKKRWNPDLQRCEQRCLGSVDSASYPRADDPRWDLSYALLPKGGDRRKVTYASTSRGSISGSPRQARHDDALAAGLPASIRPASAVRRPRLRTSWLEIL